MNIAQTLATELEVNLGQIEATIAMLEQGDTVPFIARYRKEATGGLDDTQLRQLHERHQYLVELEARRATILQAITEQDKLSPELKQAILAADNKTRLEDLYLPYKTKRRTKAFIAREAGLEPLASALLADPMLSPEEQAAPYLNPEHKIATINDALDGARHILMEQLAEDAELLAKLRIHLAEHGIMQSQVVADKETEGSKFKDYFAFSEPLSSIPSHRILALFRGRKLGFLQLSITFPTQEHTDQCVGCIYQAAGLSAADCVNNTWLQQTMLWTWKIKLHLKLSLECMSTLKQQADLEAIEVFRDNLKHLLLAAPAGQKVVLGLDPGFRTGVKTVVIDDTGKLLHHCVIFPHQPQKQWPAALKTLSELCQKFKVELVSIGNGTASRETDQLVGELQAQQPELKLTKIVVSEAGASVYSASELAAHEFPDLDVSYRGAVSIARRLQDPLAELVKIDPKAIGVGQYQHDVNQSQLNKTLQASMEDCINAVGADLNTASAPLLSGIAGLNANIAAQIIQYREQHGRFKNRQQLLKVPRLGAKTFEQCAGFLRITQGDNPLDASAVHPESYSVVDQISQRLGCPLKELIGNKSRLQDIQPQQFVSAKYGLPTICDILAELLKPGRDPRPEFKMAKFASNVHEPSDLVAGMQLEGAVTNVANFGAFVDIGVHQDGLVHVSEVADVYVKNIHDFIKVGDIVTVTVLEVDLQRKRIQLSMKSAGAGAATRSKDKPRSAQQQADKHKPNKSTHKRHPAAKTRQPPKSSPFANQLLNALKKDS